MDPQEIVRNLPLVTAIVFYAVVAIQILRNRVRTWTESFFASAFLFGGTYALCDFFYLRSTSPETAMLIMKVGMSSFTLAMVFLFLFTRVFFSRMERIYLVHIVLPLAFIGAIWTIMLREVVQTPWGWEPHYDRYLFSVWTIYVVGYAIASIWNLGKTHAIARTHSRSLGRKVDAVIVGFVFCLVAGLTTNVQLAVFDVSEMPLFSALLAIPAFATLLLVLPVSWRSLVDAARRWGYRRYTVEAAYLMYADGTLMGSRFAGSQDSPDSDLFLATLDTIQNFMKVSFPIAGGRWLKVIDQGDMRIVIERGEHASLVLVVRGEEDELLTRRMKETLGAFETLNGDKLVKLRGIARDARGTEQLLNLFFMKEVPF